MPSDEENNQNKLTGNNPEEQNNLITQNQQIIPSPTHSAYSMISGVTDLSESPKQSNTENLTPEVLANAIQNLNKSDLIYLLETIRKAIQRYPSSESSSSSSSDSDESQNSKSTNQSRKRKTKQKSEKANKKGKVALNETIIQNPQFNPNQETYSNQHIEQIQQDNSQIAKIMCPARQRAFDAQAEALKKYSKDNASKSKSSKSNDTQKHIKIHSSQTLSSHEQNTNDKDNTKPPPIVIRPNQDWINTRKSLIENNIIFKTAPITAQGIKIQTPDMDTYKKALRFLDDNTKEYHTYTPKEDRDLHVVIRGAGLEFSTNEVTEYLQSLKYQPIKVSRMTHPITKFPMPLLLIALPRDDPNSKNIYNLKEMYELKITVEPLRVSPVVGQCKRCQFFGHHHDQCKAGYRCKFCAGAHDSYTCKDKDGQRKCCNCGGNHLASYRGCKNAPNYRFTKTENTQRTQERIYQPSYNNFPNLPNSQQQDTGKNTQIFAQKSSKTTAAQVVKSGTARYTERPIGQDLADISAQLNQLKTAIFSVAELFTNMARAFSNINA